MSAWEDKPTSGYDRRDIEERFRGVLDRNENLEEALRGARLDLSITRSDIVKAHDYAAKCERAIAALAKVIKEGASRLQVAEAALDDAEDFLLATAAGHPDAPVEAVQNALGRILGANVAMLAAVADPLVSECVAQAAAPEDDASARPEPRCRTKACTSPPERDGWCSECWSARAADEAEARQDARRDYP